MGVIKQALRWGLLFGAFLCPVMLVSQSINQTQLRGTVTDTSGAIIQGAKVTITDVGTNISQTTTPTARADMRSRRCELQITRC